MTNPGDTSRPPGGELRVTESTASAESVRRLLQTAAKHRANGAMGEALAAISSALDLDPHSLPARLVNIELRHHESESQLVLDELRQLASDDEVARHPYLALAVVERLATNQPDDAPALARRSLASLWSRSASA